MRTILAIALTLLGLCNLSSPALAAPAGTFYIRGWGGYATQSLKDVNDDIRLRRSVLQANPVVASVDVNEFGGAPNFGIESGFMFTEIVSAGLGFSYQSSSRTGFIVVDWSDGFGNYFFGRQVNDWKITAWDLLGTAAFWIPAAPGLHFGAQVGVASGSLTTDESLALASDVGPLVGTYSGDWSGTGIAAGVFAGYDLPLGSVLELSGRFGYRYRKIGRPDGSWTSRFTDDSGTYSDSGHGPLRDMSDAPMDLDVSGIHFNVGLRVGLGGSR